MQNNIPTLYILDIYNSLVLNLYLFFAVDNMIVTVLAWLA